MSIGKYRSGAFSAHSRHNVVLHRNFLRVALKAVGSKFSEKRIIISTRKRSFSVTIPWYIQFLSLFAFLWFFIWFSTLFVSLRIQKNNVDAVYKEMQDLKDTNKNLVSHIQKVNADLEDFNSTIASKIHKKQERIPTPHDEISRLTEDKKYQEAANLAIESNVLHVASLMDHLNMYLSHVTQAINSLGLNYESFIDKYEEFKKVATVKNIMNISNSRVSPEDRYPRYKRYYFFVSSVADEFFKTATENISKSVTRSKYEILTRLESVLKNLPLEAPFLSGFNITSGFGYRKDPFIKSLTKKHKGIDLKGDANAVIVSSGSGVVAFAGKKGGYGNIVEINHGNGIRTRYAHLKEINVSTGQIVSSKEKLGRQGSTGSRCKGAHLHYELLFKNKHINPIRFIYAKRGNKKNNLQQI